MRSIACISLDIYHSFQIFTSMTRTAWIGPQHCHTRHRPANKVSMAWCRSNSRLGWVWAWQPWRGGTFTSWITYTWFAVNYSCTMYTVAAPFPWTRVVHNCSTVRNFCTALTSCTRARWDFSDTWNRITRWLAETCVRVDGCIVFQHCAAFTPTTWSIWDIRVTRNFPAALIAFTWIRTDYRVTWYAPARPHPETAIWS